MIRRGAAPGRQRGVALLVAIILVAIATMLATAIFWRSSISARRGTAVFTAAQGYQLALGGEALSAYLLHDALARAQGVVSPAQDWSRPYGPYELDAGATFLGEVEDMQGRFNLNSVVTQSGGTGPFVADPEGVAEFMRLLQALQIDTQFAARLVDWIDSDDQATSGGGAEDSYYQTLQPAHRTPNRPLSSVSELLAMGMDRASYDRLRPFVAALPPGVTINICTAPGLVLDAVAGSQSYANMKLAEQRSKASCFPDRASFLSSLATGAATQAASRIGTSSKYFRLRAWVTLGTTRSTLYSLLEQESSGQFRPILRTFGTE